MKDIKALIERTIKLKDPQAKYRSDFTEVEKLAALMYSVERLNAKNVFAVGQAIQWKPGLKNRNLQGPFIVLEVLALPSVNPEVMPSSPYYGEQLDIVIATVDSDGDFFKAHVPSELFEPFDEKAAKLRHERVIAERKVH